MNTPPTSPEFQIFDALSAVLTADVRAIMNKALDPEERDDRFDSWPTAEGALDDASQSAGFLAVVASIDGRPVGYLGGDNGADGRLQLDALVDESSLGDEADHAAATLLNSMLDEIERNRGEASGPSVELWGRPARPWHHSVASTRGLTELRALHQMRCRLPVEAEALESRAYESGDLEGLRSVNNRAFASHPDQGSQTAESLLATMNEPWFVPEGVRIHERDGRIAGFCWTKIHPSPPAATELGEIYVIGVDPDFHGQGLGVPMTAAGLVWLADQGIDIGMLYVEADNVPAIRTYERLGFTVLRTDRAWIDGHD